MILTPYRVTFHPVVVIGLGKNLLFKSVLAHCVEIPYRATYVLSQKPSLSTMSIIDRQLLHQKLVKQFH